MISRLGAQAILGRCRSSNGRVPSSPEEESLFARCDWPNNSSSVGILVGHRGTCRMASRSSGSRSSHLGCAALCRSNTWDHAVTSRPMMLSQFAVTCPSSSHRIAEVGGEDSPRMWAYICARPRADASMPSVFTCSLMMCMATRSTALFLFAFLGCCCVALILMVTWSVANAESAIAKFSRFYFYGRHC